MICAEEVLSSSVDFRQQTIASAHFEGIPSVSFQVQKTVVHLTSCDNKQQPLRPPPASIVTLLSHNPYLRYPKKVAESTNSLEEQAMDQVKPASEQQDMLHILVTGANRYETFNQFINLNFLY